MKPTTISYGRTFAYNYQSYRADIKVELEPWETDLDACFDNLRQMVHDQIGRQSEDFDENDSNEIIPLREYIRQLCREIDNWERKRLDASHRYKLQEQTCDKLEVALGEYLHRLKQVVNALRKFNIELDSEVVILINESERFLNPSSSVDEIDANANVDVDDNGDDDIIDVHDGYPNFDDDDDSIPM